MIAVNNLFFSYTQNPFIQDMSFSVSKGEIFGFLGPSGAGKSTLQKILLGMITDYQGSVMVNRTECKHRSIDQLLQMVGLENDADKRVANYSKGMKARLNFIKALLHDPSLLFLDEPTSGLDPTNNRMMKDMILEEKKRGKTILLTTHNMQDAAELCDRVAFIVNGQIFALDSPHNLIMSKGAAKVTYAWLEKEGATLREKTASCPIDRISKDESLQKLIAENRITSIHSSEPTLNDIFVEVTGRTLV
ncbi:MAG: ABC transporter ATP-binding protein [Firmicutes bacterium]|nr:ABC transporter ATP-binding protein [Bacillota bacterium]